MGKNEILLYMLLGSVLAGLGITIHKCHTIEVQFIPACAIAVTISTYLVIEICTKVVLYWIYGDETV